MQNITKQYSGLFKTYFALNSLEMRLNYKVCYVKGVREPELLKYIVGSIDKLNGQLN